VAPRGFAEREQGPPTTVAVGFNGSDESRRALAAAAPIAARLGAKLLLVAVVEPQGPLAFERELAHEAGRILRGEGLSDLRAERLRAEAERAVAELDGGSEAEIELTHGDPVDCLVDRTETDVALLVLGSRGYGPLRRTFLGSVASGVLGRAFCPTLVVPR
jgi:nucleotide-binding universal stress UspA family protein